MAQFFISRPVLAWVFALFICIAGLLALPFLPVAQYPKVAPPQLTISTAYPGASPQEIYQGVTRLIEEELNGVAGLIYFESTSDTSGGFDQCNLSTRHEHRSGLRQGPERDQAGRKPPSARGYDAGYLGRGGCIGLPDGCFAHLVRWQDGRGCPRRLPQPQCARRASSYRGRWPRPALCRATCHARLDRSHEDGWPQTDGRGHHSRDHRAETPRLLPVRSAPRPTRRARI